MEEYLIKNPHKKYEIGLFLDAGGNKAFFVNGVLDIFNKEAFKIDKVVGYSSSAAIVFSYLFNKTKFAVDLFETKLNENEKNFYWFRENHFPHDKIYESGIAQTLQEYPEGISSDYFIIATITSKSFKFFKLVLASLLLGLRVVFKINLMKLFRKMLGITEIVVTNMDNLSRGELTSFIMGSSTIYPFIQPRYLNGKLIMEGGLLDIEHESYLNDCNKKIIIHTVKGKTRIVGNVLHIYSHKRIPNNVLDYTDGSKVVKINKIGESAALKNLQLIKKFIDQKQAVDFNLSYIYNEKLAV